MRRIITCMLACTQHGSSRAASHEPPESHDNNIEEPRGKISPRFHGISNDARDEQHFVLLSIFRLTFHLCKLVLDHSIVKRQTGGQRGVKKPRVCLESSSSTFSRGTVVAVTSALTEICKPPTIFRSLARASLWCRPEICNITPGLHSKNL